MRASVFPTSVLPTPASPSRRSGRRMRRARKIAVASPRSGRYDSAASACSTSSTDAKRTDESYGVYARRGDVRDVLETLERWLAQGMRVATATVVKTERSAPRQPGAVLAVSEGGEVAGSVTGGCVEPAVFEEARAVLAGGPPRLVTYGIADGQAFEGGLPCGGTGHIFIDSLDPELVPPLADAVRAERPVVLETWVSGPHVGDKRLVSPNGVAETELVTRDEGELFVSSFAPRPTMYVFGAVDHAAAVVQVGRLLGYRVTVCDARARFVTRER